MRFGGLRDDVGVSRCRYIHDDSETSEDQVALRVTDGVNAAEAVLLVQVGVPPHSPRQPHPPHTPSLRYPLIGPFL